MNNRLVVIIVAAGLGLFALAFLFFFMGGGGPGGVVEIDTSMGKITVELNGEQAPISVKNFLKYVDAKHYDGTIFHRVISNFMIQGGGLDENMRPKLQDERRSQIKNEGGNGLKNGRGTIAMARTDDPDSATDQFFINVKDNDFLNKTPDKPGYAVFGKVIDGMKVVDKIRQVETHKDMPIEPVIIRSIRRVD